MPTLHATQASEQSSAEHMQQLTSALQVSLPRFYCDTGGLLLTCVTTCIAEKLCDVNMWRRQPTLPVSPVTSTLPREMLKASAVSKVIRLASTFWGAASTPSCRIQARQA